MAWSLVGVGTVSAAATATPLTLTEPAGVADGDLLVACIASRSTATTAVTSTGWTAVGSQNNNNTLTTGSAIASGAMLYRIRSGTPTLTFTLPATVDVAIGRIIAYRGNAATTPLDVSTAATTATSTTAVSVTGLTTTVADDLIVAMVAGGQEAAWSAFNATTPAGASGATDTTTAPSATWRERADTNTTTGSDTSLAIFDALKTAAGATGNLTATASLGAGHVVIAGAFKIQSYAETTAWSAVDKSANITLSASNKTATLGVTAPAGVRSTRKRTNGAAGKYYAEWKTTITGAGSRFGFSDPTQLPDTATAATFINGSAVIFVNNVSTGIDLGSILTANTVCMAWDTGAERVWFRVDSGLWNNDAGADPAAGTGGLDCSYAASVDHALWWMGQANTVNCTIRTELAEYTQAVPSGFTSWMGETPSVSAVTGTGSATLSASAAASGVEGVVGTVAATVNASAEASGTHDAGTAPVTGTVAATLALTAAASGTYASPVTGTAAATLAASSSASGVHGVSGAAAATIALSGAANGVQGISGTAAATLALSAAAIGTFGEVGAGLIGVWTGSAWVDKPMMVWTGSAWVQKPVMSWDGSAWV